MLEADRAARRAEPPIVADIATAQELLGSSAALSRIDLKLTQRRKRSELARNPPRGTVLAYPSTRIERVQGAGRGISHEPDRARPARRWSSACFSSTARCRSRSCSDAPRSVSCARSVSRSARRSSAACSSKRSRSVRARPPLGSRARPRPRDEPRRSRAAHDRRSCTSAPSVRPRSPSPKIYVRGAALGIAGTLLAGAKPALDAARAAPAPCCDARMLERRCTARRARRRLGGRAAARRGALLLAGARPEQTLYAAFAGLFGVIGGGALLVPAATLLLMRALEVAARPRRRVCRVCSRDARRRARR